jgi:hypothetical protein
MPNSQTRNLCRNVLLGVGVWVLAVGVFGCDERFTRYPLLNAHDSPVSLARAVLDAVGRRDATTLRSLALSEEEFREHVWPELPAARPERNLPFGYVWGDLQQKSENALRAMLATHGGRRYELVDVAFAGETTRYQTFSVHRETTLRTHDEQGAERALRLYGSTLQKDGTFKIFSYVVD